MRTHQIENWALQVVERVEAKQPHEDFTVELKSDWPDPQKGARQIAGHANAAGGEPILWLIGVNEDTGVTGASQINVADWYAMVRSEFDGLAPQLTDISVPRKGLTFVALFFEADRAPFVVKNPAHGQPGGGPVSLEVPWRENTSTRSANRSELLRLLSPLQRLPSIEVLGATLTAFKNDEKAPTGTNWQLELNLYALPKGPDRVVIPSHKCQTIVEIPGCLERTVLASQEFNAPMLHSLTKGTRTEAILDGPGVIYLTGGFKTNYRGIGKEFKEKARVFIHLLPVEAEKPISLDLTLSPVEEVGSPIVQVMWHYIEQRL